MKPITGASLQPTAQPWSRARAAALVAMAALGSALAQAQSGYFITPSIAITELYDDNIFFTLTEEESAAITRVSPALELGFESPTLNWDGRYRIEAEQYRDHSELNANTARRFADVAVEYLASSRLTLSADADYTKTNTPVDLSVVPGSDAPGLLLGRRRAERTSISPAARYQFSRTVAGSMAYTRIHDQRSGAADTNTHRTATDVQWKVSAVSAFNFGYIYTQYQSDAASSDREDSHVPWLGLAHEFSRSTSMVARAGPRLSSESTTPYLLFGLRSVHATGYVLLEFERDESILLGEASRQEFQRYSATLSRRFGTNLELLFIPTYTRLKRDDTSPDIYRAVLESRYRFNDAVALTAAYRLDYQELEFSDGSEDEVTRNLFQLGIRFTYPRPTRER